MFKQYFFHAENLCYYNKFYLLEAIPKGCTFIQLKDVRVTFYLSSKPNNLKTFICMLLLIEKFCNSRSIFLLDLLTLSAKKPIKVGCILQLKHENASLFVATLLNYSLPKIKQHQLVVDFASPDAVSFKVNKMLFNATFLNSKDFNFFYDFLDVTYNINYTFRSFYRNVLITRFIFSLYGFNHFARFEQMNNNTPLLPIDNVEELFSELDEVPEADPGYVSDDENTLEDDVWSDSD